MFGSAAGFGDPDELEELEDPLDPDELDPDELDPPLLLLLDDSEPLLEPLPLDAVPLLLDPPVGSPISTFGSSPVHPTAAAPKTAEPTRPRPIPKTRDTLFISYRRSYPLMLFAP